MASVETGPKMDDEAKEVPPHKKEKMSGERRESASPFGGLAAESHLRVQSRATTVDQTIAFGL